MLTDSTLKEQAIADLDYMLMATSAVTSVYHWRMRRMPDVVRSQDAFGNGEMLEDWLLPTYCKRDGFKEILGSDMNLRFAGRDVSHAVLILIHSQLLSRPLEQFFTGKLQEAYPDAQVPRRAVAAMLQHGTEGYVQAWLDGDASEYDSLPITSMRIPSRDIFLELGDDDLPDLVAALAEARASMQRLLEEPEIQQLLQQTYMNMQIMGYEQQDYADDPLHLRNGETIVALEALMHRDEALQASIATPLQAQKLDEIAQKLRLVASSIRQVYGEVIESKDGSLMPPKRASFGCGRLMNQTIQKMDYPNSVSSPDPVIKPGYVASRLDVLAEKIAASESWAQAAEMLGTYDRLGGRSMGRYLQSIRPLEWAETLLEHATAHANPPLGSEGVAFVGALQEALKGVGKEVAVRQMA